VSIFSASAPLSTVMGVVLTVDLSVSVCHIVV